MRVKMRELQLFLFALFCIVALFIRILALQVNKRVPHIPVWLSCLVLSGFLIISGIRALKEQGQIAGGIRVPLATLLKKQLSEREVFYTNDSEYLRAVFNGEYPDKLKMVGLGLTDRGPEQMKMFDTLKKCNNFHATSRASLGNSGFVVWLYDTSVAPSPCQIFLYFPQTGELGRGKDWCDVPPEFRQWTKTLKPGVSVPIPTPESRSGAAVR